jgi:hypothetical protein
MLVLFIIFEQFKAKKADYHEQLTTGVNDAKPSQG